MIKKIRPSDQENTTYAALLILIYCFFFVGGWGGGGVTIHYWGLKHQGDRKNFDGLMIKNMLNLPWPATRSYMYVSLVLTSSWHTELVALAQELSSPGTFHIWKWSADPSRVQFKYSVFSYTLNPPKTGRVGYKESSVFNGWLISMF